MKTELTEGVTPSTPAQAEVQPLPRRPEAVPDAAHSAEVLTTTTTMRHGLAGLATHHRALRVEVTTLAQALRPTPYQPSLDRVLRLLHEMDTTFATTQAAHTHLTRALHETRLLLNTRDQAHTQAVEEQALLQRTVQTLTQEKARETNARQRLQDRVTQLEADLMQMHAEHRTLTTQHESLVSEYHQLFLSFQKASKA